MISIFEHEVSVFALAAHNIKDDDLIIGVTVEYSAGAADHLSIAVASKFWWNFAISWVPPRALHD